LLHATQELKEAIEVAHRLEDVDRLARFPRIGTVFQSQDEIQYSKSSGPGSLLLRRLGEFYPSSKRQCQTGKESS
jgi:hypothetical protein